MTIDQLLEPREDFLWFVVLRPNAPVVELPVGILLVTVILAGCGSTSGGTAGSAALLDGGSSGASDGAIVDTAGDANGPRETGGGDSVTAPVLTVTLDPTLDQPGDDVKASSITGATLLDETGTVKAVATVSSGSAVFVLEGLKPGDYFIEINGDADDVVPTRIDDPASSTMQTVGQKLRASYVGPAGNPAYRVNTYSAGQNESPVVTYSDGTTIAGEQPYLIYSFATSQLEIRLLGTAAPLTSLPLPRCVGHAYDPADGWLLNTTNEDHHGDFFNADGGAAECQTCHWYGSMKKYSYSAITPTDGWCYECHNGTGGSAAGFVDPTK
jgi:hypothetical protein